MLNINFNPFPVLTTERLTIRRITNDDANELFFLRSDETVMQYVNRPKAQSMEDIGQWVKNVNTMIDNNDGIAWGIALRGEPKIIGTSSFHILIKEHYRAVIGYVMHPQYHGKGYMQEAVTAMLDYGFKTMGLHSVEAHVNPANIASIKLLERCNFVREGYFKEDFFWEGKFLDSGVYSLLAPNR